MKRIIIVRHAKSVQYGYDDDFHRDLTERGVNDADKISARLHSMGIGADAMIASPATRTRHTASVFCYNLGFPKEQVRYEEILYHGLTTQDFIEMLQGLPETMKTVVVVGHNPTVYYLVNNLVKYFNGDMPTCSTVAIDFEVEKWNEISARKGQIAFHFFPKGM